MSDITRNQVVNISRNAPGGSGPVTFSAPMSNTEPDDIMEGGFQDALPTGELPTSETDTSPAPSVTEQEWLAANPGKTRDDYFIYIGLHKLPSGEWISQAVYDSLDDEAQTVLDERGLAGFNTWAEENDYDIINEAEGATAAQTIEAGGIASKNQVIGSLRVADRVVTYQPGVTPAPTPENLRASIARIKAFQQQLDRAYYVQTHNTMADVDQLRFKAYLDQLETAYFDALAVHGAMVAGLSIDDYNNLYKNLWLETEADKESGFGGFTPSDPNSTYSDIETTSKADESYGASVSEDIKKAQASLTTLQGEKDALAAKRDAEQQRLRDFNAMIQAKPSNDPVNGGYRLSAEETKTQQEIEANLVNYNTQLNEYYRRIDNLTASLAYLKGINLGQVTPDAETTENVKKAIEEGGDSSDITFFTGNPNYVPSVQDYGLPPGLSWGDLKIYSAAMSYSDLGEAQKALLAQGYSKAQVNRVLSRMVAYGGVPNGKAKATTAPVQPGKGGERTPQTYNVSMPPSTTLEAAIARYKAILKQLEGGGYGSKAWQEAGDTIAQESYMNWYRALEEAAESARIEVDTMNGNDPNFYNTVYKKAWEETEAGPPLLPDFVPPTEPPPPSEPEKAPPVNWDADMDFTGYGYSDQYANRPTYAGLKGATFDLLGAVRSGMDRWKLYAKGYTANDVDFAKVIVDLTAKGAITNGQLDIVKAKQFGYTDNDLKDLFGVTSEQVYFAEMDAAGRVIDLGEGRFAYDIPGFTYLAGLRFNTEDIDDLRANSPELYNILATEGYDKFKVALDAKVAADVAAHAPPADLNDPRYMTTVTEEDGTTKQSYNLALYLRDKGMVNDKVDAVKMRDASFALASAFGWDATRAAMIGVWGLENFLIANGTTDGKVDATKMSAALRDLLSLGYSDRDITLAAINIYGVDKYLADLWTPTASPDGASQLKLNEARARLMELGVSQESTDAAVAKLQSMAATNDPRLKDFYTPRRRVGYTIDEDGNKVPVFTGGSYDFNGYWEAMKDDDPVTAVNVMRALGITEAQLRDTQAYVAAKEKVATYRGDLPQFLRDNPTDGKATLVTLGYDQADIDEAAKRAELEPDFKTWRLKYYFDHGVTDEELALDAEYNKLMMGSTQIDARAMIDDFKDPAYRAAMRAAQAKIRALNLEAQSEYIAKYGGDTYALSIAGNMFEQTPGLTALRVLKPDVITKDIRATEWVAAAATPFAFAGGWIGIAADLAFLGLAGIETYEAVENRQNMKASDWAAVVLFDALAALPMVSRLGPYLSPKTLKTGYSAIKAGVAYKQMKGALAELDNINFGLNKVPEPTSNLQTVLYDVKAAKRGAAEASSKAQAAINASRAADREFLANITGLRRVSPKVLNQLEKLSGFSATNREFVMAQREMNQAARKLLAAERALDAASPRTDTMLKKLNAGLNKPTPAYTKALERANQARANYETVFTKYQKLQPVATIKHTTGQLARLSKELEALETLVAQASPLSPRYKVMLAKLSKVQKTYEQAYARLRQMQSTAGLADTLIGAATSARKLERQWKVIDSLKLTPQNPGYQGALMKVQKARDEFEGWLTRLDEISEMERGKYLTKDAAGWGDIVTAGEANLARAEAELKRAEKLWDDITSRKAATETQRNDAFRNLESARAEVTRLQDRLDGYYRDMAAGLAPDIKLVVRNQAVTTVDVQKLWDDLRALNDDLPPMESAPLGKSRVTTKTAPKTQLEMNFATRVKTSIEQEIGQPVTVKKAKLKRAPKLASAPKPIRVKVTPMRQDDSKPLTREPHVGAMTPEQREKELGAQSNSSDRFVDARGRRLLNVDTPQQTGEWTVPVPNRQTPVKPSRVSVPARTTLTPPATSISTFQQNQLNPENKGASQPGGQNNTNTGTDTNTNTGTETEVKPDTQLKPALETVTITTTDTVTRTEDKLPDNFKPPRFPHFPDSDKAGGKNRKQAFKGGIGWKSGFGAWVGKYPYKTADDFAFFDLDDLPANVDIKPDAKTAYETYKLMWGNKPPQGQTFDLGIMDVTLGWPEIKFTEDRNQQTQHPKLGGMPNKPGKTNKPKRVKREKPPSMRYGGQHG